MVLVAACSSGDDGDAAGAGDAASELPAGYEGHESDIYADGAHWLCKPGIADDVCSRDLDATAVFADGIGHSQGGGLLNQFIAEEIDDEPLLRDRLVAAYILGASVAVPEGEVLGGDFANVPLCESDDQTGWVVTYASFRSTSPPPEDSFFGVSRGSGEPTACVNPAAPAGATSTPNGACT